MDRNRGSRCSRLFSTTAAGMLAVCAVVLLSGCFGGGYPTKPVEQYILDYAPAKGSSSSPLPELLSVERFTTVRLYAGTAMVYKSEPNRLDDYLYHRWRLNPGDMVAECLLRDLRHAGIFLGVFSFREGEPTRFRLAGSVTEFLEMDGKDGRKAVLALEVTLLDTSRQEIAERVVFQKGYQAVEPLPEETPAGLARGMSAAMEKVSAQVLADLEAAATPRKKP